MDVTWGKTKEFLELLSDKNSKLYPFYERNFRVALRTIPVIGDLIDTNYFETLDDEIFAHTINELETKCEEALSTNLEFETRFESFEQLNQLLLFLIIQNFEDVIQSNKKVLDGNREILSVLSTSIVYKKEITDSISPSKEFLLLIISGPSAVGKDVILDSLERNSYTKYTNIEILQKISTREQRIGEHHYHRIVKKPKFEEMVKKGHILFRYEKHNNYHGFDRKNLFDMSFSPTLMFAIHTEYKEIEAIKHFLKVQGINSKSILIEAPENDLFYRTRYRNFPIEEVRKRQQSINRDFNFFRDNNEIIKSAFDAKFYNGNDKAVSGTVHEIIQYINML